MTDLLTRLRTLHVSKWVEPTYDPLAPRWYRFEDVAYAPPVDEWGDCVGRGRIEVHLRTFTISKETPKGVRLDTGRFVLKDAKKRYACPTIEEARASFIARKSAQLRILQEQTRRAQIAITAIQNYKE